MMSRNRACLLLAICLAISAPAPSGVVRAEESQVWIEKASEGFVTLAYGPLDPAKSPLFLLSCFDAMGIAVLDLHIALEVEHAVLEPMLAKGRAAGIDSRGIADHHFIQSIYFRDPNGYVIELTARMPNHDTEMNPQTNGARDILDRWQANKDARS